MSDHVKYKAVLFLIIGLLSCREKTSETSSVSIDDVAGNEEVARFMRTFEGRGALSDSSTATSPADALKAFKYPDDLEMDLVLAEPSITQPVFMNFDHRGRLWVVQYNQYPYPRGLKVLSMDQYLRSTFDKIPQPPPSGMKGADKITFFEDTDGDGTFDEATDAISGLNLATSVTLGREQIWVLDPPYLLAYPDPDNNGIPDGPPVVHLRGFGLEDTHAVANSLRWGPDGWLYGAQGSTCTANVSSSVSKNVRFNGQAIWRYNPGTEIFEIYAEGGGNTFYVEIDDKGRFYSGHNGIERGQYYKQGAYYVKNMDKHGAHTNPYTFGYLGNMVLEGDRKRFTHAFIRYEGGNLPARYDDKMIAINPLQNYLQLTRFEVNGSTFKNIDEDRIVTTNDKWFRPVDIKSGPDGAVYLADWYDSRLSHVDPRDTWHKTSGRIYRLRNKNSTGAYTPFDLTTLTNDALIGLFSHQNKWFRQQALLELGNRKDKTIVPQLISLLKGGSSQESLEALWAIHLSGGFDDRVAMTALRHEDPYVRMWAVRLSGDDQEVSPEISQALIDLAKTETHAEVRSQLAATAKRLPGVSALAVVRNLLVYHDDSKDPDIPLQLWWAVESKTGSHKAEVIGMFEDPALWKSSVVLKGMLQHLMQRLAMEGGAENFSACARLLKLAPAKQEAKLLLTGLQDGLKGKGKVQLPGDLLKALKPYQAEFSEQFVSLALRQGDEKAMQKALSIVADHQADKKERLAYIEILGEINQPKCVPTLLKIVEDEQWTDDIRVASLQALQRYDNNDIGVRVTGAYPRTLSASEDVRFAALSLLASRASWTKQLLDKVEQGQIRKEDVPDQIVAQLLLINDAGAKKAVTRLWPEVRVSTASEKNARIAEVVKSVAAGTGNPAPGKKIYMSRCGSCHRLFNEGGMIGPDLTGYDRKNLSDLLTNIIDPSAYIREGYVVNHVTTHDGRTLVGTIKERSGSTLTLETFNGERIALDNTQIKEMTEQRASLMPERILNGLDDQEIRDLMAYIMKYE